MLIVPAFGADVTLLGEGSAAGVELSYWADALPAHSWIPDRVRAAQRSGWPDVFGSVLARLCGAFGEPY